MNLKIFNCHSFNTIVLDQYQSNPDIYVPVGGGGFKDDYVKLTDNTGDNISIYNEFLNEITVIYWVAKHLKDLGDPEYIGFGHYRRFLTLSDDILKQFSKNTIIVSKHEALPDSVYSQYVRCHVKSDIDAFIVKFAEYFPEMKTDFGAFLSQNIINWCNMFIMHRDKFAEYFHFMETCIKICINDLFLASDISKRRGYQRRACSFLLERLTAFFYFYQKKYCKALFIETPIIVANINSIYHT